MSQISLTIIPSTATPTLQPAGGWGSWSQPNNLSNPYPLGAGNNIYSLSSLEISRLRDYNLVSDETCIFYRIRLLNVSAGILVNTNGGAMGLTGARTLRSLARLQADGLIKRYSISEINLSWIIISQPLQEAQIRADWQAKLIDDNSYVYQVLNLQRQGSTSSLIDLVSLFPSWGINSWMLGEAVAHYAGSAVNAFSCTLGNITVELHAPLNQNITDSELTTIYRLGLVGENFFHYINMRSQLSPGTKSQIINLTTYVTTAQTTIERYLKALLRLKQSTLISALQFDSFSITWVVKPNTNEEWVRKEGRTQLKEPGYFVHQIAIASSTAATQQVNPNQILSLMKLSKRTVISNETALNYLLRAVPDTWQIINAQDFTVVWL